MNDMKALKTGNLKVWNFNFVSICAIEILDFATLGFFERG